ncbi:hypothetical protein NDI52_29925 [Leptolyngbya sp. PL-A3]|uniref:hypothetical protein n=1 Tax=Leptolyngbya sp. PL-A3 TaxID=2933911 RepID=UPI00329A0415
MREMGAIASYQLGFSGNLCNPKQSRFDAAFGITWSEDERDQQLSARLSDRDLEAIGMLLAEDDDLRRENIKLRWQLAEFGADPYALPGDEGGDS